MLRRRCPHCGAAPVFRSYLHADAHCRHCGLLLDRGEVDFFVGAYTINLIAAELFVVLAGAATLVLTWPAVPWTALTCGLAGSVVLVPVLTYPWSRQLWLAFDLVFRPAEADDFVPERVDAAVSAAAIASTADDLSRVS